jgi:hypothetical protein
MRVLSDVAEVIRSKNAGPFVVTFDVFFKDKADFEAVRAAGLVTRQAVCERYNVGDNELLGFEYYPFANALKFSLQRSVSSGGPRDADAYGAQQHAPLLDMPALPE